MCSPTALIALALLPISSAFVPQQGSRSWAQTRASENAATVAMGIKINAMDYTVGLQDPGIPLPPNIKRGDPPQSIEVTAEQRNQLLRDGAVIIPGVLLKDGWLEYLRTVTEWQIDNPHIWASPGVASNLYDYIQRNVWTTNKGFVDFMYHGPVGSVLAQLGGDPQAPVRLTTDLLMVNPNKGFKWHQDNQNGPIEFKDALRWWITMDDTPADFGAPVYLKGSQNNTSIDEDAVFVDIAEGDLPAFPEMLEFRPKAGDMIIWHARTIHKIDGAPDADWGSVKRRVLGGTVAVGDCVYAGKQKVEFADMGRHDLVDGDMLANPHFPLIWPRPDPSEQSARYGGRVGRSFEGAVRMWGNVFSGQTLGQFGSWLKVYNKNEVKPELVEAPATGGGSEAPAKETEAAEVR